MNKSNIMLSTAILALTGGDLRLSTSSDDLNALYTGSETLSPQQGVAQDALSPQKDYTLHTPSKIPEGSNSKRPTSYKKPLIIKSLDITHLTEEQ